MSAPPSVADVLRAIVSILDLAANQSGWNQPAQLINLGAFPDDVEAAFDLGVKPLPKGMHPLAALDGFIAPLTWQALGVVAEGKAYSTEPAPPGRPPETMRARVIELVARDGSRVSALRLQQDGAELQIHEPPPYEPIAGGITAALYRALGVPIVGGRPARRKTQEARS
jgi:hypothetical protein